MLCSIELLPGEWLDLETPTAHKGIAHILSGHPPGTSKYVACIQYIEEIADLLLKEYGIQLKMVMVGLPVPPTTRRKLGNPRLTFPADAYIVLEAGIQDLKILPR